MTRHNNDIAACGHATCPSRGTCLRWQLGQRMEDYHWFGEFKPKDGVCAYHIWTNERADDAVLSNMANTGKNYNDNNNDNGNKEN